MKYDSKRLSIIKMGDDTQVDTGGVNTEYRIETNEE